MIRYRLRRWWIRLLCPHDNTRAISPEYQDMVMVKCLACGKEYVA